MVVFVAFSHWIKRACAHAYSLYRCIYLGIYAESVRVAHIVSEM